MIYRFTFPTRIVFGPGALAELKSLATEWALKRPLIVTDKGVVRAGLASRVVEVLGTSVEPVVFDGVEPNPTEDNVETGAVCYRENRCDGVIALGGGSSLDAGKAIALRATHRQPLEVYDDLKDGGRLISSDIPPMIAIPTTAGTGSEVGRSAVITLKATDRKTVLFSPHLMPKVAVCDPELTLSLPQAITAATGTDALTHCIEAYLAIGYHPMCDGIALRGAALAFQFLPRAVANGTHDLEARSQMMMTATMGATAFQKGLGVTHSLAHPLSSVAGVPHGLANAILLPHALRFNAEVVPERLADLGRAIGLDNPLGDASEGATLFIAAVERLLREIGIPAALGTVGVTEAMIPTLVAKALEDGCHLSNPRLCSADDFERLYRAALSAGQ